MRTRIGLLLSLLAILLPLGCQPPNSPSQPELPLTYVGSGQFGFSENGITVASQNSQQGQALAFMYVSKTSLSPSNTECNISMYCSNASGHNYSVNLSILGIAFGPAEYQITSSPAPYGVAFAGINLDTLRSRSGQSGIIKITKFDTINNVISGMFQFIASVPGDLSSFVNVDSGYFNDIPIAVGTFDQGTITATVNGQPFGRSSGAHATLQAADYTRDIPNNLEFVVQDRDSNFQKTMQISIPNPKQDSTYDLSMKDSWALGMFYTSPLHSSVPPQIMSWHAWNGSGSLTVTKYDPVSRRISANFSFTAPADSSSSIVQVTNGVIDNVQYYISEQ
jgi:hypothetical protein